MKNFIHFILCVVIASFLDVQAIHAAFPVLTVPEHSVSIKIEKRSFEQVINSAIERYHRPVPPVRDADDEGGKTLNIAALGLGVAGVVALIATLLVPAYPFVLGGLAAVTSLAAIITGAYGMELSPLRGLGTTGFVLGIVTLSALVIVGIIAFLSWLAFGTF